MALGRERKKVARLHLIDNVLGLEEAEKFFESIPQDKRDDSDLYTTILSFYTRSAKTLEKAELIFHKMRKLGYLSKPCPFNHMMSLYNQIGKRDMVHQILSQMEKNNVKSDNRTLNIILGLLAESHSSTLDWRMSCEMAKTYLKQGRLVVEALKMLRRAEESVVDPDSKKLLYESLMVLYGEAGKAEEVYRIWGLYNNMNWRQRVDDEEGYKSVITALLKLNDINGAGTIVNKWYGKDVRIITMMASAYCEKGQLKDAEELLCWKGFRFIPKKVFLAFVVCYGYTLYSLGVNLF